MNSIIRKKPTHFFLLTKHQLTLFLFLTHVIIFYQCNPSIQSNIPSNDIDKTDSLTSLLYNYIDSSLYDSAFSLFVDTLNADTVKYSLISLNSLVKYRNKRSLIHANEESVIHISTGKRENKITLEYIIEYKDGQKSHDLLVWETKNNRNGFVLIYFHPELLK